MSPRLPSATTSRFAARAYSQTSSKARRPSAPIVSKYASWAFTPTTYGAAAQVDVAAQLHGQEFRARIEPHEELAPLAVDRLGDAIAECQRQRRRGRSCL